MPIIEIRDSRTRRRSFASLISNWYESQVMPHSPKHPKTICVSVTLGITVELAVNSNYIKFT
jgi:uncharacterized membrane protein YbaN (DUF454 family)